MFVNDPVNAGCLKNLSEVGIRVWKLNSLLSNKLDVILVKSNKVSVPLITSLKINDGTIPDKQHDGCEEEPAGVR